VNESVSQSVLVKFWNFFISIKKEWIEILHSIIYPSSSRRNHITTSSKAQRTVDSTHVHLTPENNRRTKYKYEVNTKNSTSYEVVRSNNVVPTHSYRADDGAEPIPPKNWRAR